MNAKPEQRRPWCYRLLCALSPVTACQKPESRVALGYYLLPILFKPRMKTEWSLSRSSYQGSHYSKKRLKSIKRRHIVNSTSHKALNSRDLCAVQMLKPWIRAGSDYLLV